MRRFVLIMIPLALMCAEDRTTKQKPKSKAETGTQAAPRSGSISIPADAVELGPQVYRWKDPDGKSWLYRKTPFGISKLEEQPTGQLAQMQTPAPQPANSKIKVKAVDRGDTVRFEQLTPMGARVWERKKSELTTEEKAWLDETRNGGKESEKPEK